MNYAAVLALFCLLSLCLAHRREHDERREARKSLDELMSARARRSHTHTRRGWLDCKALNTACRGFPPCCDENVCYFANGISTTAGVCVKCVANGQTCQRDGQCCESLVCQKDEGYQANGKCGPKKPNGAECHDNDQCLSEYCQIHWYNDVVMGHGGRCAAPAHR